MTKPLLGRPFAMKNLVAVVLLLIIIPILVIRVAPGLKAAIYGVLVRRELRAALAETSSWQTLTSQHIDLRYQDDSAVAAVVLEVAEEQFQAVSQHFGYRQDDRVLLIMHNERESLRQEFGWDSIDDASGVYWGGTVRVLSPRAYGDDNAEIATIAEQFASEGPLAHEFTHYVLDRVLHGNYPRWFSEGLAQYEEYRLLGYLWANPDVPKLAFYAYEDLDGRFDRVPNQAIAYRQAFLLTYYMVSLRGWDGIADVMTDLRNGAGFGDALYKVYGLDAATLESQWLAWLERTAVPPYDASGGTASRIAE